MSQLDNKLARPVYEFGPFRLAVAERQLLRAGEPLRLTPKVFDLLVVLVESNGRLLEKEELMTRVWPDSYVEEGNINRNISTLRRALNGDGDGEAFIETVPKRGYRFIAPVRSVEHTDEIVLERRVQTRIVAAEEISEVESAAAVLPVTLAVGEQRSLPRPSPGFSKTAVALLAVALVAVAGSWGVWRWRAQPVTRQINTLAILPFKFLGADKPDEYLALGMTDVLITRLASLRSLAVRPTSAVLKYQQEDRDVVAAGRALRVDAVLDGQVQKFGKTITVRWQLIRVMDGLLLTTGEFGRQFEDLLLLHDSVTAQVAQALNVHPSDEAQQLLVKRYTRNVEAYQAYLKGRYLWNKRTEEAIRKSITYFQQALEIDPHYALAYTGLADCYASLTLVAVALPPKEVMIEARKAALKALEIDDRLAEAHSSLGLVKLRFDYDWAGAERDFRRAIQINPNYTTAHQWYGGLYLLAAGRFDEALAEMRQAQELDPTSLGINWNTGVTFYFARRYDQAIEQFQRTLEIEPNFGTAFGTLALAYEQKGMYVEAIAALEKAAALLSNQPSTIALLGQAYALAGRKDEARNVLRELNQLAPGKYVLPYFVAHIHAALGEKERAFALLEKTYEERHGALIFLNVDPGFDNLRTDPRFTELLRRIGLSVEPHNGQ